MELVKMLEAIGPVLYAVRRWETGIERIVITGDLDIRKLR